MEKALSYSLKLYGADAEGILLIRLPENSVGSHSGTALITEHRPLESRQYVLRLLGKEGLTEVRLPSGDYSIVVVVPAYEPFRTFVTVNSSSPITIEPQLQKRQLKDPTFEEILAKNMIRRDVRSLRNLTVDAGSTVTLDQNSREFSADREYIQLRSLKDVKRVLGSPDSAFVGENPRFGRFASAGAPANYPVSEALDFAQRAALQEFVHGNSRSVATWHDSLDKWIGSEEINVWIWALLDIDVGRNAVLEITSAGLVCNKLSVHYTGKVRFKGPGPIKLEMNHYVRYGLIEAAVSDSTKDLTLLTRI